MKLIRVPFQTYKWTQQVHNVKSLDKDRIQFDVKTVNKIQEKKSESKHKTINFPGVIFWDTFRKTQGGDMAYNVLASIVANSV